MASTLRPKATDSDHPLSGEHESVLSLLPTANQQQNANYAIVVDVKKSLFHLPVQHTETAEHDSSLNALLWNTIPNTRAILFHLLVYLVQQRGHAIVN